MAGTHRGRGQGESSTSTRQIAAVEREVQAVELRKLGLPYETIAQRLGYANASGALKAVRRALAKAPVEAADELRQITLLRLERLYAAVAPRALSGNLWAVDRCLAILRQEAELLGLNVAAAEEPQTLILRFEGVNIDAV